jgi:DNA-binding transcriptional MerR regulator
MERLSDKPTDLGALMLLDDIDPAVEPVERREAYPAKVDPQGELTTARYWQIYTDYTTKHRTMKQLAEDTGYTVAHIKNIIKWCVKELEGTPAETYKEQMIEKVSHHLQKLERILESGTAIDVKDQLAVFREIRLAMQLLGKTQGSLDEKTGKPTQININLPNIGRGTGARRVVDGDPYQDGKATARDKKERTGS